MSNTSDPRDRRSKESQDRLKQLGRAIKTFRGDRSQEELGILLAPSQPGGLPIPQTTISRWERGSVDLTLEQVLDLERALGVKQGTLGHLSGYIDSDLVADATPPRADTGWVRHLSSDDPDEIADVLRVADLLDLDVEVRSTPGRWEVTVTAEVDDQP